MNNFAKTLVMLAICMANSHASQDNQYAEVNYFNVPDELNACLAKRPELIVNGSINPFYLSGDFDGDGKADYVVQVKNAQNNMHGVLFCFANETKVQWGAGHPNEVLEKGMWPFNSWLLFRKGSKHLSPYPKIKTDVIALIIADEGGGLLYWDGKKFRWISEE